MTSPNVPSGVVSDTSLLDAAASLTGPNGTTLPSQVLPWDELDAKEPPRGQLKVSTDPSTSFSVLVAQSARKPTLLTADMFGRARSAVEMNEWTTAGRAQAQFDQVLQIVDPTFGGPGAAFLIFPASGAALHGPYQIDGNGTAADGTCKLTSTLTQAVAAGDGIRRLQILGLSQTLNVPVSIQNQTVEVAQQGDFLTVTGIFGPTATPTLVSANFPNSTPVLVAYSIKGITFAAASLTSDFFFKATAFGSVLWRGLISTNAAANSSDRDAMSGLAIPGVHADTITMVWTGGALPANTEVIASFAYRLQ